VVRHPAYCNVGLRPLADVHSEHDGQHVWFYLIVIAPDAQNRFGMLLFAVVHYGTVFVFSLGAVRTTVLTSPSGEVRKQHEIA